MKPRRSVVTSLVLIAVALVLGLAPTRSIWVEQLFSEGVYATLQPPLTRLSNVIPFAIFDALLIFVALVLIVWLVAVFRRPRARIWQFLLRTATLAAGLYLVFLMVWGLNYRREPLRRTLEFRQEQVTPEALAVLAGRAVAELNAIHGRLPASWPAWDEMRSQLGPGFERARRQIGPKWPVEPGDPKRSLLNVYFKLTGIEGMVDPLFLEVLVNRDVLPFERPFIVAHEWGHLAGRADESEASFHGFLTCMHGPLWARYSAWISLYGTILAGLPPDAQRVVAKKLDAGPRRDLQALRERILSQSLPLARRASGAAYDRFLKANRLREGVKSYDLVVTLLLGVEVELPELQVEKFKVESGK